VIWKIYLWTLLVLSVISIASTIFYDKEDVSLATYVGVYMVAGLFMLTLQGLGIWQ
jgi:hypothetical protein